MKPEAYFNYTVNYFIYDKYRSLRNIFDPWKVLKFFCLVRVGALLKDRDDLFLDQNLWILELENTNKQKCETYESQ